MIFTGVLVEALTTVVCGALGSIFGKFLPERSRQGAMAIIGVAVMYMAVTGAQEGENIIVILVSLLLGTVLGEGLNIDERLKAGSQKLNRVLTKGDGGTELIDAFVTASLIFCVGAMSVLGPLKSGLAYDHSVLYAKAVIVAVTSFVLASSLGPGGCLAAITILVYEGSIALLASLLAPYLTDAVITSIGAVGSVILLGVGLNILEVTQLRLTNQVPAIFLPILIQPLVAWLGNL